MSRNLICLTLVGFALLGGSVAAAAETKASVWEAALINLYRDAERALPDGTMRDPQRAERASLTLAELDQNKYGVLHALRLLGGEFGAVDLDAARAQLRRSGPTDRAAAELLASLDRIEQRIAREPKAVAEAYASARRRCADRDAASWSVAPTAREKAQTRTLPETLTNVSAKDAALVWRTGNCLLVDMSQLKDAAALDEYIAYRKQVDDPTSGAVQGLLALRTRYFGAAPATVAAPAAESKDADHLLFGEVIVVQRLARRHFRSEIYYPPSYEWVQVLNAAQSAYESKDFATTLALLEDATYRPASGTPLATWMYWQGLATLRVGRMQEGASMLGTAAATGAMPDNQLRDVVRAMVELSLSKRDRAMLEAFIVAAFPATPFSAPLVVTQ